MDTFQTPGQDPVLDHLPEFGDHLDETFVTVPCYEPSGLSLDFTGRALCTHTLLLGQTGCGKTSILRWFVKRLICRETGNELQKAGVFIFDLNGDDTVELVRKWAAEAGRQDDVRLLTSREGHLELFANLKSLEDLPSVTAQFMYGRWCEDADIGYWSDTARSLIDAALSMCFLVQGRLETDTVIRFLTNWLVAQRPVPEDELILSGFAAMAAAAPDHVDKILLGKIEHVRATVEMWGKLDGKTKGILNSCLLDALGPLISMETRRYLDDARGTCFTPEDIVDGRIMVFSLPAGKNVEAASLLGRIIKARLYIALQERRQDRNQRLCAVIADEYHYLASGGVDRSSDVTALATLRSRSVAVIAATQSLDHLAGVMGSHDFRALLPNLGNQIFLRSTEATTAAFATHIMGMSERKINLAEDLGHLVVSAPSVPIQEYICPPGALALLEVCQAYVAISTGYRSNGMVWLAGNHDRVEAILITKEPVPLIDQLQRLRDAAAVKPKLPTQLQTPPPSSPEIIYGGELKASVRPLFYTQAIWERLLEEPRFQKTCYPTFDFFCRALASYGHQPAGLESVPICWWEAIVKIAGAFTEKHPIKLSGLHQIDGRLMVFVSGTGAPETYLKWIVRLQSSLYPICTRRLKIRDQRILERAIRDEYIFQKVSEEK